MATIKTTTQILVVGAGTDTAQAIYELKTSDNERVLLRKSSQNPYVYFMDHDAIKEYIPTLSDSVIALFEDVWPEGLDIELTTGGYMPEAFNGKFATADYKTGFKGLIALNGFDVITGGYKSGSESTSGNTDEPTTDVKWYNKPLVKKIGWGSLGAGAIALVIWLIKRKR